MNLEEALQKSKEAAEFILQTPQAYGGKYSPLPGVGIGFGSDNKEYQLIFRLNRDSDITIIESFYSKLDVREKPRIEITGQAFSFSRFRPLKVGADISLLNDANFGTLGCFVRKKGDPKDLFILTCTHVIAPHNEVSTRNSIVQPARSTSRNDIVAELDSHIPLSSSYILNPLDAAIARVVCQETLNDSSISELMGLRGDYAENEIPQLGRRKVFKIGSRTGMTSGIIDAPKFNAEIRYPDAGFSVRYPNLISIRGESSGSTNRFSVPGDSGSLIYDEDGYAVGLLVGGIREEDITYALPIEPILTRLDIELVLSNYLD